MISFLFLNDLLLVNAYGPTEATVSCTYKKITQKNLIKNVGQSISIGKTIKGMKIKLLENGKFSRQKGEILICYKIQFIPNNYV